MIKITEQMKNQSQKRFNSICKQVDDAIQRAVDRGHTSTVFMCDKDGCSDIYSRVRKAYEDNGYHISPSGYCGGDWQRSEDISW